MLAAASVLDRRGHEVAVLASGETREAAERLGFEVTGYRRSPDPDAGVAFEEQADLLMAAMAGAEIALDAREVLDELRPDLAVVDCMLPAALAAAQATGIAVTRCSYLSKTTRCSAGTTSGSSSSRARPNAETPCATSTAALQASCCSLSRMPWLGAGPRAATGAAASNPSSLTSARFDPARTSAKPERHGRPAGSRAHFLKLNATGCFKCRAPVLAPSPD
jgi:hypothetical protein